MQIGRRRSWNPGAQTPSPGPRRAHAAETAGQSPRLSHPRVTGCLLGQGRRRDPGIFLNIPPVLGGTEDIEPSLPPAKMFQSQIKKECKLETARKPEPDGSSLLQGSKTNSARGAPPPPPRPTPAARPRPPRGPSAEPRVGARGPTGAECAPPCPALSAPGAVGSPRRPGCGPPALARPHRLPGARTPSWESGRSPRVKGPALDAGTSPSQQGEDGPSPPSPRAWAPGQQTESPGSPQTHRGPQRPYWHNR